MECTIVIPEITIKLNIKYQPNVSERFPWTLYLDGTEWNGYSAEIAAQADARNLVTMLVERKTRQVLDKISI